jgi:hypothetical protein
MTKQYSTLNNDLLSAYDKVIIPQKARMLLGFYIRQTVGFTRGKVKSPDWKMSLTYPMGELGWTQKEVRYWQGWLIKYKFIFKTIVPWQDEKHPHSKNKISCITLNQNFQTWQPPLFCTKRITKNDKLS